MTEPVREHMREPAGEPAVLTGTITDVPGVLVGHHEPPGGPTGVTVVLVPAGATGAVEVHGATGTRETDVLEPSNLVRQVQGICLAGGGGFGLAAADGVVRWLAERGHGFLVGGPDQVVPVVPTATLADLPPSAWRQAPGADTGYAACAAATGGAVRTGRVGVGSGAGSGLGTAGLRTAGGPAVGALVALGGGTAVVVLAVDGDFDKAECRRLTVAARDGLARGLPPGERGRGVVGFALATGHRPAGATPGERIPALNACCAAGARVVEQAVSSISHISEPEVSGP